MLREVDIDKSDPRDHLGDYAEDPGDPYPASVAAHRVTREIRGDVHADPDEAREYAQTYAARPHRHGTQTREITPGEWTANGHFLRPGSNAFAIVETDYHRVRLVVTNYGAGDVYLSPMPTRLPGAGALLLPYGEHGPQTVELRTTAPVHLFTLSDYSGGYVQVYAERHPG